MEPINVVWFGVSGRLRKNCTAMLNEMLDKYECVHWVEEIPPVEGAVVVVHGESCMDKVASLNIELSQLKWVVLIYLGDECQQFPVEHISHPNMKLWVQDADWRRPIKIDRFLPGGYAHGCAQVNVPRDLDWFFAGQITHEHRRACIRALELIPDGGFSVQTKGYTQGISHTEYFRCLSRAKFVPCPSGPHSTDSTRVWEALECGAIPIVDASSPVRPEGFWDAITPDRPFPLIHDWAELPALLPRLLDRYEILSTEVAQWWQRYKNNYYEWIEEDMEALRG